MTYNESELYMLQSKAKLMRLLKIPSKEFLKQSFICKYKIHPYIEISPNGKKRLIERPDEDVKSIQKRLQRYISALNHPNYLISGVKRKCHIDNAKLHQGNRYFFKTDFTAFFPNTSREKVYSYFLERFCVSPDVAEILANFTTVDLDLTDAAQSKMLNDFLQSKNIKLRNHLLSGAPTSQLLSFYCNESMFAELDVLSQENGALMTVYVDDVVFSSEKPFTKAFKNTVRQITKKYYLKLSKEKVKAYGLNYPKKVTGVVIDKNGQLQIPNSLRLKIMRELQKVKQNPSDEKSLERLRGLLVAARQIDNNAFPSIKQFVCSISIMEKSDKE